MAALKQEALSCEPAVHQRQDLTLWQRLRYFFTCTAPTRRRRSIHRRGSCSHERNVHESFRYDAPDVYQHLSEVAIAPPIRRQDDHHRTLEDYLQMDS